MSFTPPDDSEHLIREAARGDEEAQRVLLGLHRERLRRMVALRLDPRVSARMDASDIVQEALHDAARKLADYARDRPLPFYPWLHRLAAERLALAHRHHLNCQVRDAGREVAWPDGSAWLLADHLVGRATTPGLALIREERRRRVHDALGQLAPTDREILVMRFLEDLPFAEVAAILGIREGAAKMRQLRALQRMRDILGDDELGSAP